MDGEIEFLSDEFEEISYLVMIDYKYVPASFTDKMMVRVGSGFINRHGYTHICY